MPTPPHDDPHGGSGQNPGSYDPPPAYWENPGGQGVPPGGYGQDPGGYGQDPGGQGANPSGYPPPGDAYSQNSAGYGQDPNVYGPPPGGYGNNGGGYNPNASGYGTPPAAFAPPPGGYGYPPGDFGQPPPGAPYGGFGPVPPHMTPIPSYLWQSIVVTLLCCIPAGVVAIVYASKVQSRQQFGDIQGASDASKKARTWCIVSLVLGLLAIAVLIALMAAGVLATEASYEVGTVD